MAEFNEDQNEGIANLISSFSIEQLELLDRVIEDCMYNGLDIDDFLSTCGRYGEVTLKVLNRLNLKVGSQYTPSGLE